MYGGQPGALSLNVMIGADGSETVLKPQTYMHLTVKPGDKIYHRVSASGGYGDPLARDPAKIASDIREGKLSVVRARDIYKVVVDPATFLVDAAATATLRTRPAA
jgi:N-methylhydantoinase B